MLWVHWDYTSSNCRYQWEDQGKKDVQETDLPRSLNKDEFVEIGIRVERGPDGPKGKQTDGGAGNKGVVIRKDSTGLVKGEQQLSTSTNQSYHFKVKWLANQTIEEYKYGCNGLFEVAVSDIEDSGGPLNATEQSNPPLQYKVKNHEKLSFPN